MRYLVLICLLLSACGNPATSETAKKLNGVWHDEAGGQTLFDFDQGRVLINGKDYGYKLDRVEGDTVILTLPDDTIRVRLIGDDTAEWTTTTTGPFTLTRGPSAP